MRPCDRPEPLGLVTHLGYLYCAPCAGERGAVGDPVRGLPHDREPCEACGRALIDVAAEPTKQGD